MTLGIGFFIEESKSGKADLLAILEYSGLLRLLWIPKTVVREKKKRKAENYDGTYCALSYKYATSKNIPSEIFILDFIDFLGVYFDVQTDIWPALSEVVTSFSPVVSFPALTNEIASHGFVPVVFKSNSFFYLIPANQIVEYCPASACRTSPKHGIWRVLVNETYWNQPKYNVTCKKWYKSFTFVVNRELWIWENGKISKINEENINDDTAIFLESQW